MATKSGRSRRDYGTGAVYQRHESRYGCPPPVPDPETGKPVRPEHKCSARWYGEVITGWTSRGTRAKKTISAKTEAEAKRRLRKMQQGIDINGATDVSARTTVKQWAEKYLELRKLPPKALSPNGWQSAAGPIRKWIIPAIGHKRLDSITPGDVRAIAKAQYDAGRKTSTADATQRVLMTMLNRAVAEGYHIPALVLGMEKPGMGTSDRRELTIPDSLACLAVASEMQNGVRWLLALLYGPRQGEVLGITEDEIDREARVIRLEWQLQALQRDHGCEGGNAKPSCGKKKGAACSDPIWRMHRDYESIHLDGAYHLVRPKSRKGYRVLPLIKPVEAAIDAWLKVRPVNEHGLLFPRADGKPMVANDDRTEFHEIQTKAKVAHPGGRPYHVHECRNFFATQAGEAEIDDKMLTELIGHSSIRTTRGYQGQSAIERKRAAIEKIAKVLEIGGAADGENAGQG